jgi:hypothetical protein
MPTSFLTDGKEKAKGKEEYLAWHDISEISL